MDAAVEKLEKFAEIVGQIPAAEIAGMADVPVDVVEAWLASRAPADGAPAGDDASSKDGAPSDADKSPAATPKVADSDVTKPPKKGKTPDADKSPAATPPKPPTLPAPKKETPVPTPKPRRIERIRVLQTTGILVTQEIKGKAPRKLKIPVPKSEYRGDIARKYASILKPTEFEVLESSDE